MLFGLASFFSLSPSLSRYVSLLRVASSVQQSSATSSASTVLVPFVIRSMSHLRIPFVLFALFSVAHILLVGVLRSRTGYIGV